MKLVLTGDIGVGKSTLVRALLARWTGPVYGLRTFPVDSQDRRQGFALQTLPEGAPHVIATPTGREEPRFDIHQEVFNNIGVKALDMQQAGLGVVDELGLFECKAHTYVKAIARFARRSTPSLIVVQQRAWPFWSTHLPQANPILVTLENRTRLVRELSVHLEVNRPSVQSNAASEFTKIQGRGGFN